MMLISWRASFESLLLTACQSTLSDCNRTAIRGPRQRWKPVDEKMGERGRKHDDGFVGCH
jgi:hypothetical protein